MATKRRRRATGSKRVDMNDGAALAKPSLVGHWQRVDPAATRDPYPVEIDFAESTFSGRRGPDQGLIYWDAGIYRPEGRTTLVLSTYSDELVKYPIMLDHLRLEVTTADHGVIVYERKLEPPP